MKFSVRKLLLAGTAIAAASTMTAQAHAAPQTLTGNGTWAGAGTHGGNDAGDASDAAAGDSVNLGAFTLTVTNDQSANDGGGLDSFSLGAVSGAGALLITGGNATDLAVSGTTINLGAGGVTIDNDGDDASVSADFSGAVIIGGSLTVRNTEDGASTTDVSLTTGALSMGGATAVTAGSADAASAGLTVNGNASFAGAVTVTGGSDDAGETASLTLNGAANSFGGSFTLTANSGGAVLTLGGTAAQTVSGVISGNGTIIAGNSAGVTFNSAVAGDTLTIDRAGGGETSSAIFKKNLTLDGGIKLGDTGATGANTITFDSSGGNIAASFGTLTGHAGETNTLFATGGHVVTLNPGAAGSGGYDIQVFGDGTTLRIANDLTADSITVLNGNIFEIGDGEVTGDVTLSGNGALLLSDDGAQLTGDLNGAADGKGVLSVTADATIDGNIGNQHALNSILVSDGKAFTSKTGSLKGTVQLENNATLIIGAGDRTIEANVTGTAYNQGIVRIEDGFSTTILTGDLGLENAELALFAVDGSTFQTVSTTGNIYANTITADDNKVLAFIGGGAEQTVSGAISGGSINVGDNSSHVASRAVFNGALSGMESLVVFDNATARFRGDAEFDSAVINTGTIWMEGGSAASNINHTLTANMIDNASPGYFRVGVNNIGGVQTYGRFAETQDNVDLSNDVVIFVAGGDGPLTLGRMQDVFAGNAPINIAGADVLDASFIYKFTLVGDGNNVDVDVSLDEDRVNYQINDGTSDLFSLFIRVNDPELQAISVNLGQAASLKEFTDLLESTQAQRGAQAAGAMSFTDMSSGVTNDRLAALRTGSESGIATGDVGQGLHMWGQALGAAASQDERGGVSGYDSTTWGGAVGIDTDSALDDRSVMGVALSYGNTDVDGDGAGDQTSKIDSYQLTLYGDMDLGNAFYLNGQAAYAYNRVETLRHDIGGVSGLDAQGDYNAHVYSARAELGRDYQYGGLTVSPHATADWTHYDPQSYTETGAGGASLNVDGNSLDIIEAGTGIDVSWKYRNASGSSFEPKLSAGYRYNFGDDQVENTSSFVGGGGTFRSLGDDPAPNRFNAGASIRYFTTANWDFTASYNYDFRSDYGSHSGMVRAGYRF